MITNIIFCLITLSALTGCIVLVLQNYGLKNKAQEAMSQLSAYEERDAKYIYTQADVDSFVSEASETANEERKREILNQVKSQMSSGSSASELLRGLFPEDVVVYDDGAIDVITAPENFGDVKAAMEAANFAPGFAEVTMRADNDIAVDGETAEQVQKLLDRLNELDDVQAVYSNAELPG